MLVESAEVWRVKLYKLDKDGNWCDQGTGDALVEEVSGKVLILVLNESNTEVLLHVPILVDENYERQQESIIMWREPTLEVDCALSFQDEKNCEALWQTILTLQGAAHNRATATGTSETANVIGSSDNNDGTSNTSSALPLPAVTVENLQDIKTLVSGCVPSHRREFCERLLLEDGAFVNNLLAMSHVAKEATGHPKSLYPSLLADICRSIALLGSEKVLDLLLKDDAFPRFAAVMEHDSSLAEGTGNFCEYLNSESARMQTIPGVEIEDKPQVEAITRLFRLRFLRDSLVRPGLEEAGAALIDHLIGATTNEICGRIFGDPALLTKVFLAIDPTMGIETDSRGDDGGDTGGTGDTMEDRPSDENIKEDESGKDSQGEYPSEVVEEKSLLDDNDVKTLTSTVSSSVQPHCITNSRRQTQALRFLRELFAMSRLLPYERRAELYERFSQIDMGKAFLDLCLSVLTLPEEASRDSRIDVAEMLCCYSAVCPERIRQYVQQSPTPIKPPTQPTSDSFKSNPKVEAPKGGVPHDRRAPQKSRSTLSLSLCQGGWASDPINHISVWTGLGDQTKTNETSPLWVMLRRLVLDTNVTVIDLLSDTLRMLLDSDRIPRLENERFLDLFYKHYVDWVLIPFFKSTSSLLVDVATRKTSRSASVTDDHCQNLDPAVGSSKGRSALLATYRALVDILCSCVSGHLYRMKYYILRNNAVGNVLELLQTPFRCLQLAAVRFMKTILATQDEFYFRHLIKISAFRPVLQILKTISNKDCLLTSTILELVVFIRNNGMTMLGEHIVDGYADCFNHPLHATVFSELQSSLREGEGKQGNSPSGSVSSAGSSARFGKYELDKRWASAGMEGSFCAASSAPEDSAEDKTAAGSGASAPTGPGRLAFLALAYGSDPSTVGANSSSAPPEVDVTDTGSVSPRSQGSSGSPSTPGSIESAGSYGSLSPPLSPLAGGKRKALLDSPSRTAQASHLPLSEDALFDPTLPPLRPKYGVTLNGEIDEEDDNLPGTEGAVSEPYLQEEKLKTDDHGSVTVTTEIEQGISKDGGDAKAVRMVINKRSKLNHKL